jgi:hypothetical protein
MPILVKDWKVGTHEQVLNVLTTCWWYGPSKPMYQCSYLAKTFLPHSKAGVREQEWGAQYSSLFRCQAIWVLLSTFTLCNLSFCNDASTIRYKKVSSLPLGDLNPRPVPPIWDLLEHRPYHAVGAWVYHATGHDHAPWVWGSRNVLWMPSAGREYVFITYAALSVQC